MKRILLTIFVVLVFSCYGEDSGDLSIQISIPLNIKPEIGDEDIVKSDELSIDSYFAVGRLLIIGEKYGKVSLPLSIRYSEAKIGNYIFDAVIDASYGETLSLTFGGYYKIDESTIGGFVSNGEERLVVREGMLTEVTFESKELPLCEATIDVKNKDITSIILYDANRELFLKTMNRAVGDTSFYFKVPEGVYDIYSVDRDRNKSLLRQNQEFIGGTVKIEL